LFAKIKRLRLWKCYTSRAGRSSKHQHPCSRETSIFNIQAPRQRFRRRR
jgi:hypothetical protein